MTYSPQQRAVVHGWRSGEAQSGEPFEQSLQADLQFHAGQRSAEADVASGTEADMIACVDASRIEFVGSFENTWVAVGTG